MDIKNVKKCITSVVHLAHCYLWQHLSSVSVWGDHMRVAVTCSLFSSWFFSIHRWCMRDFRGVLQDLFRHPFSLNLPKSFTNLLRQSPFSCPHTLNGPSLFNSPHTAAAAFSLIAWLPFFLGLRGYLSNLVEISLTFLLCCTLKLK